MFLFQIIPLILFTAIRAQEVNISIINIGDLPHAKIVLADNLNAPFQLAVDYQSHVLFFSTDTEIDFSSESSYLNLDTGDSVIIRNLPGGFANAVDGNNHIVYLGGRNGVYIYDYRTESAKMYSARGISVWQLFYKDYLYFTEHTREIAYVFTDKNGTFKEVPQLKGVKVLVLGVDKNDTIYFSNSSGLFNVKKGGSRISKLGKWNAAAFTTGPDGNLFFCTNRGLFLISNDKIILLGLIQPVYGMAIDRNGEIIYTNSHQIIKLQPGVRYNNTSDYYTLLNINICPSTKKD